MNIDKLPRARVLAAKLFWFLEMFWFISNYRGDFLLKVFCRLTWLYPCLLVTSSRACAYWARNSIWKLDIFWFLIKLL